MCKVPQKLLCTCVPRAPALPVLLKSWCAYKSPENLTEMQILMLWVWSAAKSLHFSPAMLVLPVQEPHTLSSKVVGSGTRRDAWTSSHPKLNKQTKSRNKGSFPPLPQIIPNNHIRLVHHFQLDSETFALHGQERDRTPEPTVRSLYVQSDHFYAGLNRPRKWSGEVSRASVVG